MVSEVTLMTTPTPAFLADGKNADQNRDGDNIILSLNFEPW